MVKKTLQTSQPALLRIRWLLLSLLFSACADDPVSGSSASQSCIATPSQAVQLNGADPLTSYQWYLDNDGSSKSAAFAWDAGGRNHADILKVHDNLGYTGKGITVNVVDTGLELSHPDLRTDECKSYDYLELDNDPQPISYKGDHGTSVAGIIGMRKGNALGGTGVAPDVTLIGHAFVERAAPTSSEYAAMMGLDISAKTATNIAQVYNQSFGVQRTARLTSGGSNNSTLRQIYEAGTTLGRQGKGYIYVKSAGNGFTYVYDAGNDDDEKERYNCHSGELDCANASEDFTNTLPQNIVVSASNAKGRLSSYSTTGSAIWVTAPGGEFGYGNIGIRSRLRDAEPYDLTSYGVWQEYLDAAGYSDSLLQPAIVTTDTTGCSSGFSRSLLLISGDVRNLFEFTGSGSHSMNRDCNYTSRFNGTSAAGPIVSGVAALMLEANPDLTWRDIKHILTITSDKIDTSKTDFSYKGITTDKSGWQTNSAGYRFSNWYGFGQINGYRAVRAARDYAGNLGGYRSTSAQSDELNLAIPNNNSDGTSNSLKIDTDLVIESVRVVPQISGNAFDYTLVLVSPLGTESTLHSSGQAYTGDMNRPTLLSNAFYGETSRGFWTLRVYDLYSDDDDKGPFSSSIDSGSLTYWSIEINGH